MTIRPIRPSDGTAMRREFMQLSARTRMQRFLSHKQNLSDAEVRYLTEVDHVTHEALVATSRFIRRPLGVARFVRNRDDRRSADLGVTVVDAWQGLGVGTELMRQLTEAAVAAGVEVFTADVLTDNTAARRLLGGLGRPVRLVGRSAGVAHYEVPLPMPAIPQQRHPAMVPALRSADC